MKIISKGVCGDTFISTESHCNIFFINNVEALEEQMLFLKFDQPDMLFSKGIHKPIFSTCLRKTQI